MGAALVAEEVGAMAQVGEAMVGALEGALEPMVGAQGATEPRHLRLLQWRPQALAPLPQPMVSTLGAARTGDCTVLALACCPVEGCTGGG